MSINLTRLLLPLLLTLGCHAPPPKIAKNYDMLSKLSNSYRPLSIKVGMIADNQFHFLYGDPSLLRTGLVDKVARYAIRPVQLDLFAPNILQWIVRHIDSDTLIHLGDAADLSCTGEYARFTKIMRGSGKRWVMAPGNHDGFFYGNAQAKIEDWSKSCEGSGEPLTKGRFIQLYLDELKSQGELGLDAGMKDFATYLASSTPAESGAWTDEWTYKGTDQPFLASVAWHIDPAEPWRSYIVQQLSLNTKNSADIKTTAILFDTCNYENAPTLLPSLKRFKAGVTGQLLPEQLEKAEEWLAQSKGALVLLMGHHTFNILEEESSKAVEHMREEYKAIAYISAHTHAGGFLNHGKRLGSDAWVEVNLASVTDWPMEYRTLQLVSSKKTKRIVLASERETLERRWRRQGKNIPNCNKIALLTKPGDDDYVLRGDRDFSGSPKLTQLRLLKTLVSSYGRLLDYTETKDADTKEMRSLVDEANEKFSDWKLEAFNQEDSSRLDRLVNIAAQLDMIEQRRDLSPRALINKSAWLDEEFRLCQAYWSSKYSYVDYSPKNRIFGSSDGSVALPSRR